MRFLFIVPLLCSLSLAAEHVTQYVNPFIGTSNFGATHPGAQYPHGMASVAPFNVAFRAGQENKFEKDQAWNSRVYIHENKFLTGFSHVNLSGVGCPDLGSILLMPTTGALEFDAKKYGSTYHNEQASPGYYRTTLDKYQVDVELSSTLRTGISRYTFPKGQSHILLNLGLGLTNETGGMLKVVSNSEVEGFKMLGTFCYHSEDVRPVYFVAKLSKAAKTAGAWKKMPKYQGVEAEWIGYDDNYKPYKDYRQEVAGDDIGAYFQFDTNEQETITVKLGISYVSIKNARQNLNAEQPGFAFEQTKDKAQQQWQKLLSRVQVKGQPTKKTIFYSALYHSLIHPNIIQDINGDYPLMGQPGIGNTQGKKRYSVYSLWDTNRNLHPLLSLLYPEIQSEMVNSMVAMAKESGWLPKWELLGMETQVMVGDPATVVIADSYLRGIQDFDVIAAYDYAKKAALTLDNNPLRPENKQYTQLGYVPVDDEGKWDGSVSTSLEYYIADWNLAQLAKALDRPQDHQRFLQRAKNYQKLFDSKTGMLRPKYANGQWFSPYDPQLGRNFEPAPGYIEGNAWNYRFYVPHDIPGLINSLGGDQNFIKQLTQTFTTDNFDMANEPDITYPFLFNYVKGEEWRSQQKINQLISTHYHNSPEGIPGNDDAGTLSAWLVFSMMGLYPVSPGDMNYALVTPSFDEISIQLNQAYYAGRTLTLKTQQPPQQAPYIDKMHLNKRELSDYFINHQQLVSGGELIFTLTSKVKK
ncbi:alpha-1 2-mannosidase [Thalassotalea insulae]|uniref:Alpha-1 2-mannosidase n=1 Tax=Thalassotalea insulae TaxID=2056778 RepID=A0ABQ6GMZ9_9GAMM|nr:GH92 family glycosyl hydrolase [Thalassotalea insulae]GLX77370.1 alpha-1 2-mannosidase [Thalassotalea insulae]